MSKKQLQSEEGLFSDMNKIAGSKSEWQNIPSFVALKRATHCKCVKQHLLLFAAAMFCVSV
jgi:hypothetical protein